jgi:tetratricopeptide (TPR) repeat protein
MKYAIILIMLATFLTDPAKIGKINSLKAEAKDAYLKGDFKKAIQKYRYLVDSLQVQEDEVLFNLANAYFNLNDTVNAERNYQSITRSSKLPLRSKAQQQLGVLKNRQGKFEEALTHFKEAIKSDPSNEDARYNYELLKKKLEEKKKQEQQKQEQQNKDQNKEENKQDQQKQDQQNKDKQDQKQDPKKDEQQKDQQNKDQQQKDQQKQNEKKEQEQKQKEEQQQEEEQQKKDEDKKDTPPSVSEKLKQMEMSEDKAKMILEAMKNQEIQYLQQNKRKATKPRDKGKPDW